MFPGLNSIRRVALPGAVALMTALLAAACSGNGAVTVAGGVETAGPPTSEIPALPAPATWPAVLPVDRPQPWEERGADDQRTASVHGGGSALVAGVERYFEGGDVTDVGEASRLASDAGTAPVSFAVYRLLMDGEQPGLLAVDANLLGGGGYFVGVADYGSGRWQWHGPLSDNHVRLELETGDHLSQLGNAFVCLAVEGGSGIDVVAAAASPREVSGAEPPPAPGGLTAGAIAGGAELQWNPVLGADVAGYYVYYASALFYDDQGLGVQRIPYLEGSPHHVLTGLSGETFVRVTTVDHGGRQSAFSSLVVVTPLGGQAAPLTVSASSPSGLRGDVITLTAAGAEEYAWDLDGDGSFDVTGDTSGVAQADTSTTGLIRPRVRGIGQGGMAVALGGASVMITGNSRPVAVGNASPQSGIAPLTVDFSGAGEDFDGLIVGGGWDFDGDGTYDVWDDTDIVHVVSAQHTYTQTGLYNARLQVIDDQGAWDVDTLAILVQADPGNQQPQITALAANPALAMPSTDVSFSATALDPDGVIASYAWDFDGDGTPDSTDQNPTHQFAATGLYNVQLHVTDDGGAQTLGSVTVSVEDEPLNLPPVITGFRAVPNSGAAPAHITFSFNADDPDGTVAEYALDYTNVNVFSFTTATAGSESHTYSTAGYYTCCLRVTDDDGARTRSYLGVLVTDPTANIPPVAVLSVDRDLVVWNGTSISQEVEFDATDSYDPDGGSITTAIDHDGDGNYTGFAGSTSLDYDQPGVYLAKLRVTDDLGDEAYDTVLVTVYTVYSEPAVSGTTVATYNDIVNAGGLPGVCYLDSTNGLQYVVGAPGGIGWTGPFTIDGSGGGSWPSLAPVSNSAFLGVSYYRTSNSSLRYAYSTNKYGKGWTGSLEVDNAANVGLYSSLAVVDGFPGIAYYDATNGNLKFVRATNSLGSIWGSPITVDSDSDNVGQFASLAMIGATPAIAYQNVTDNTLLYVSSVSSLGTVWNTPVVVDDDLESGFWCTLVEVNGRPAIGYYHNGTTDSVRFIRANNLAGTSWPASPVIVAQNEGVMNGHVSMAVVGGYPVMAWTTNQSLRVGFSENENGDGGWYRFYADQGTPPYDVGEFTSIVDINGLPYISHFDNGNDDLRVARGVVY